MNKKVSTIFAMAALMGGVFSGSAYAETIDLSKSITSLPNLDKVSTVVLKQGDNALALIKKDGVSKPEVTPITAINEDNVLNYTWNVIKVPTNQGSDDQYYIFTNYVTKDTLAFDANNQLVVPKKVGEDMVYPSDEGNNFTFYFDYDKNEDGTIADTEDAAESKVPYAGSAVMKLVNAKAELGGEEGTEPTSEQGALLLAGGTVSIVPESTALETALSRLTTTPAKIADLNALYNGYGFNLAAQPQLANVEVQNNLFATGRVWAYQVVEDYTLTNADDNGTDLFIPAGVYFFTNPKFVGNANQVTPNLKPEQINWLSSTLIALSSTQTQEGTDSDRANGAGFVLVEAQGNSFIYEENASDAEGNDLMIHNACFTINDNFANNDNYPYELVVNDFYYQKSAGYAGTDDQSHATAKLSVTSYENSYQHLVSYTGSESRHIFRLQSSSVIQGKTLLKTTKEAAIYNIRFVSGNSDLNNKYLTVGATDGGAFQWEAKGAAIADTDYPSFQYVITAVDGANVTFTNRETGISFTTQLFTEEGTDRYSMSISRNSLLAANATQTMNVKAYTVRTAGVNTYTVDPVDGVEPITANLVIQLIPVEDVDAFAGFVTEETGTIRTLAFARDKHDTSNMLYAQVDENDWLNSEYLTNDINAAAQWQLNRTATREISRVYVYFNENTQSIDNVPEGDKVKAYTYHLQYINDGAETGKYLSEVSSAVGERLKDKDYADQFIIKENVDGSVSLIKWTNNNNVFASLQVAPAGENKAVELYYNESAKEYQYETTDAVYASVSEAREIKTYLADQPADISWPANEGHVTIMSDRGNYITMDENRDGIVVNENEADTYYLYVTDEDAIVPSFYITKGVAAENGERMFLFNPTDSVAYYVADGAYDRVYQWSADYTKVMFKAASINETRDTLTMTVKGETKYVAERANDDNRDIWGGLKRFKWQIIEAADADGFYYIRQTKADDNSKDVEGNDSGISSGERYLSSWNERLTWSDRDGAMLFQIENAAAPTANEGVSATEVKIIATDGAINIKNAAGKNVVISTILGQIVANEVLTSDNATISVPAGIAIVSVDGEEAVKVSVR